MAEEKVTRNRILMLLCAVLLVIAGVLATRAFSPALSVAAACRGAMERTEGYGPWKLQPVPPGAAQPSDVAIYFDGYNTGTCHAHQIGPFWIVDSIGQTLVACGLGLGNDAAKECPRRAYGVMP